MALPDYTIDDAHAELFAEVASTCFEAGRRYGRSELMHELEPKVSPVHTLDDALMGSIVEHLWNARKQARMAKQYELSDDIRHLLESTGYDVIARDNLERGPVR